MSDIDILLKTGFDPVFIFKLNGKGIPTELVDLNDAALDLLEAKQEDVLLLKDRPVDWFPFLGSLDTAPKANSQIHFGEIYTHQDNSVSVKIRSATFKDGEDQLLALSVRREDQSDQSQEISNFHSSKITQDNKHLGRLFAALNQAAEKLDAEVTPEGVFNIIKEQFSNLGYSCSVYLTTPDQKYIYPKYLSYSPLVVKLATKFFGNPYNFMIPVRQIPFARKLVLEKQTLFVENPQEDLKDLINAFPDLSPLKSRIIEWMSRFLKKTISSPLVMNNRVFGALTVHAKELEEKDIAAIRAFAYHVAVAMHKAKLLDDLKRHLSEKEKIEKALRISEARLKIAFEAANDAIWDYTPETGEIYLGSRWYNLLGFQPDELVPDFNTLLQQIHPEDRDYVRETFQQYLLSPKRSFSIEYRIRHKQGDWRYMQTKAKLVGNDSNGGSTRFVGISSDITEQKTTEQNLIHLAFHDALTGLMNRKAFGERSDELLMAAKRHDQADQSAYMYIDLDHFKTINDTFGHNVGDECLKEATRRLTEQVRESDLLFRLGGDEFFLILKDLKRPTDASLVAEKLIKAFRKPFYWEDQPLHIQLSIGIALYPRDGRESWQLLSKADTALYKAKGERNTYRFYDEKMQTEATNKINLTNDIRQAIEADEFQIYYQPIFTCDRKLVGAEALLRWFGSDGVMISPTSFIPCAEESGLIIPMGVNVVDMVIADMAQWQQKNLPPVPVSINISAKQLKQQELIVNLNSLLQSHQLDPGLIHLEITESSLMENLEDILGRLDLLKASGLKFSIDDFGTGYSSLSHLKHLPIDTLKIDKSFITDLPKGQDSVIVQAIISLAEKLELKVIAEGVETRPQFEFLKANGAPLIQGFYFSKPLSKKDFAALISNQT